MLTLNLVMQTFHLVMLTLHIVMQTFQLVIQILKLAMQTLHSGYKYIINILTQFLAQVLQFVRIIKKYRWEFISFL